MKGLPLIFILLHETAQYVFAIRASTSSRPYCPVHLIQHLHLL